MSKNFIGVILLCALVVYGYYIMPIYFTTQIDMAKSQEIILNETEYFLDKVADTREITEKDLEDFTLGMASTIVPINFEIRREEKQVNPDPASTKVPKTTHTTWVPSEDIYNYNTGDIIIITVEQIGQSYGQSFSNKALHMFTPEIEFTLSRMVR